MKKSRLIIIMVFLIGVGLYVLSYNPSSQTIPNNITFKAKLSEYGLFKANMSDLNPNAGVEIIEIASTLFTDYSEKQRLLKIPDGKKVLFNKNDLPTFPEGSILAKTFFYSNPGAGNRKIIETRLLILNDKKWNAATYRWNANQSDAILLTKGAVVPISFIDQSGRQRDLSYKIPSQSDCSSCHGSKNELTPLGPKTRNLNITVNKEGIKQNQITYLINKGIIAHADIRQMTSLPNYRDSSLALPVRARAYLEINCAHCHQPSGRAGKTSLDLRYTTPFDETGIDFNKQNIMMRMSTMDEYHMPKIGTTVIDEEGLRLVKAYIKKLK